MKKQKTNINKPMINFDNWLDKNKFDYRTNIGYKIVIDKSEDVEYLVTIVIPTYKREELLLRSLKSAIFQNCNIQYEILIIDNDSYNGVNETIVSLIDSCKKNIRYIKNNENIGMFCNWNRGIYLARGSYVCILNDDDVLDINFLKEIYPVLLNDYDLISNAYGAIDLRENIDIAQKAVDIRSSISRRLLLIKSKPIIYNTNDIKNNRSIGSCCFVLKKATAIELGGFNEKYGMMADLILFHKINYYGSVIKIRKCLSYCGLGSNESLSKRTKIEFILSNYKFINSLNVKPYYSLVSLVQSKRAWPQEYFEIENEYSLPKISGFKSKLYLLRHTLNSVKFLLFR